MATQRAATYAPGNLTIVITHEATGIAHVMSGFSEDSIVQIERVAETFTMYTGADNFSTRVFNSNNSARMTFSLQQTSATNDVLTGLYEYDKAHLNSDGMFSIHVKDNSGRSDYFSDDAYVGVVPNSNFSNSMQTRDWVIHAHNMEQVIGGNAKLPPEVQATLTGLGVPVVDTRWI